MLSMPYHVAALRRSINLLLRLCAIDPDLCPDLDILMPSGTSDMPRNQVQFHTASWGPEDRSFAYR